MENEEKTDNLEIRAREAYQDLLGSLDQVGNQDNLDYQVIEDFQDRLDLEVCKVKEDNLGQKDFKVREVSRVAVELQDQTGYPDLEGRLGDLEPQDNLEKADNRD